MKRIIVLMFLVALFLFGCLFSQDSPLKIIVKYDGGYYVFMKNTTDADELYVYVTYGEGVSAWLYTTVAGHLGGDANHLEIEAVKVLGDDFPDYGNLLVQLKEDGEVLEESVAPAGTQRAFVFVDY